MNLAKKSIIGIYKADKTLLLPQTFTYLYYQ
jgi:hypothetical protein